jgi:hypothetical protein
VLLHSTNCNLRSTQHQRETAVAQQAAQKMKVKGDKLVACCCTHHNLYSAQRRRKIIANMRQQATKRMIVKGAKQNA